MAKPRNDNLVQLLGGTYLARSVIASAQRCVNLVPEINPGDSETPVTHYLRAGLRKQGTPTTAGQGRGLYRATNGDLFAVVGTGVYFVDSSGVFTLLGSIAAGTSICSMTDDTSTMVLVDGTATGYEVVLATHAFSKIVDPEFLGADKVDFLDTFVLSNVPDTQEFQSTHSNSLVWDPLFFASKTGFSDKLVTLVCFHREIWLLGTLTSEVWFNAGNPTFPFAILPGVFFQHGCAALYSVATHDQYVFWLDQDKDGARTVVMGEPYKVTRISTYAIEEALRKYKVVSDAIGFMVKLGGHIFYYLTFPSADATWVYDKQTELWHEETWTDGQGQEHRSRLVAASLAYGINYGQDWENGTLYQIDPDSFTDAGVAIVRRRGFPHILSNGNRVSYGSFSADMQAGEQGAYGDILTEGEALIETETGEPLLTAEPPAAQVFLRWSDNRGRTWGNPIAQSFGDTGEYLVQPQWSRLGMARDRVFELFWDSPQLTALNGAWIDPHPMGS